MSALTMNSTLRRLFQLGGCLVPALACTAHAQ
jgi:hypothetical protein